MSNISLNCPICSGLFQVEPANAGQHVACPLCQNIVAVPDISGDGISGDGISGDGISGDGIDESADSDADGTADSPPEEATENANAPDAFFYPPGYQAPAKPAVESQVEKSHSSKPDESKSERKRKRKRKRKRRDQKERETDPPGDGSQTASGLRKDWLMPPSRPKKTEADANTGGGQPPESAHTDVSKTDPAQHGPTDPPLGIPSQIMVNDDGPSSTQRLPPDLSSSTPSDLTERFAADVTQKLAPTSTSPDHAEQKRGVSVEPLPDKAVADKLDTVSDSEPNEPAAETADPVTAAAVNKPAEPEKSASATAVIIGPVVERQQVDTGIVLHEPEKRIERDGEEVTLRRLTPEEKQARRFRRNLLLWLVSALVLVATLIALLRTP